MIVYAAIDLHGGQVVQLVGGRPEAEHVRVPDPVGIARRWVEAGFRALHVVDLDAALATAPARQEAADARGATTLQIKRILQAVDVPVQVGGGIRDDVVAAELLEAGAARVVVGTRAVEEPAWLETLAQRHPGRIVMAADVRGERVVTRGWTATTELSIEAVLERVESLPLAGILITDVTREGRMSGIDAGRFGALVARTRHPIIAAGGVAGLGDLRALAATGVAGVVLGMALYTEAIDAAAAASEFAV